MIIVEREIFENGGYQVRMNKDKVIIDACNNGKFFSEELPIIEFYAHKLVRHVNELTDEISDLIRMKDGKPLVGDDGLE